MMSQANELRLHLFGLPQLEFQGRQVKVARRKAVALAAYLALADHRQSRDVIVNLLWPELDHDHGRSALRSTLLALTTPVPLTWIDADRTTVGLKRDTVWVDVRAFTDLLSGRESHGHALDAVCDQCAALYKQASALYQSDFMAGFSLSDSVDYDDWQLAQREWLRREFADIQRRLSIYYAEAQNYGEAIKHAQQWLSTDTLHEPAHRQLMRLYAANGQRSEALRQYKQAVDVLDAELATPPEDETTDLYETILKGQFSVVQIAVPAPSPVLSALPPLPPLVIGRDEALREIKRRLGIGSGDMRAVTVIQGWPGVGKSTTIATLRGSAVDRLGIVGIRPASRGGALRTEPDPGPEGEHTRRLQQVPVHDGGEAADAHADRPEQGGLRPYQAPQRLAGGLRRRCQPESGPAGTNCSSGPVRTARSHRNGPAR